MIGAEVGVRVLGLLVGIDVGVVVDGLLVDGSCVVTRTGERVGSILGVGTVV